MFLKMEFGESFYPKIADKQQNRKPADLHKGFTTAYLHW